MDVFDAGEASQKAQSIVAIRPARLGTPGLHATTCMRGALHARLMIIGVSFLAGAAVRHAHFKELFSGRRRRPEVLSIRRMQLRRRRVWLVLADASLQPIFTIPYRRE